MVFSEKVRAVIAAKKSYVCVGLDTDLKRVPDFIQGTAYDRFTVFNKRIIDATIDYAAAYKLNSAFYEAEGPAGIEALIETIRYLPDDVIIIEDAKRGDIGNTAAQYARAIFENHRADAVTLNPYMGYDCIEPFLAYEGKGCFVLCLTSNKGAGDFQKLELKKGGLFYQEAARKIAGWSTGGGIGMVVGATQADELSGIREIAPDIPLLIPGIGKQGGDLRKTVEAGIGPRKAPALINSSRGIIFRSSGEDYAESAGTECKKLRDDINSILDEI